MVTSESEYEPCKDKEHPVSSVRISSSTTNVSHSFVCISFKRYGGKFYEFEIASVRGCSFSMYATPPYHAITFIVVTAGLKVSYLCYRVLQT